VDLALKQNPDVLLSNIEEQRALAQVAIAKDPFVPKIVIGSGLAYSNGFPMSIEGSAPSVVQARAIASVYNKPQRLAIAQAKEEARAAGLGTQSKREEAIAQVVQSFLAAERRGRQAELAGKQLETAEKLLGIVKVRVTEGRELPLEGRRAELEVAKAKQRIAILAGDVEYAEGLLGMALGLPPGGLVRPAREDRDLPEVPDSAESAVNAAMADNREIRRLQSQLLAKGLQAKGHRAERLPSFDLVAQYGLFAKFNNYEDFFRRFQRNNGQLGVSFQLPLLFGPGREARASLAEIEVTRIKVQVNQTRSKIALEIQKRYADLQRADTSRQIAKMDLDLTRESLAVQLARFEEGRATMRQVEEARFQENEKWMAYYDSVTQSEGARYALLEMTGGLVAALR
jgi:outer membrane protein TolC